MGYACKGKYFTTIEELILVKGMKEPDAEKLGKLKTLITVYGDGRININTASKEVFKILGGAAVSALLKEIPGLNINENDADDLTEGILNFRNRENGYFSPADINTERIRTILGLGDIAADNKTKIIDRLITWGALTAISNNFKIGAQGNVGRVNKRIAAIVKRGKTVEITHWHEN